MEIKRLGVLGGDRRQIEMARALARRGYRVSVWGLGDCEDEILPAEMAFTWLHAVEDADAVILPLPASADGVRLYTPLQDSDELLRMTTLLDAISGKYLFGGRMTEAIRSIAEGKSIEWIDYFDNEALQLKNAVPTAEGAIAIAMRELPVTIDGTDAVILGYGRIGAALGERLQSLGAKVTVYARRAEQRALAEMHRHTTGRLICRDGNSLPEGALPLCRVIFNTVPHRILTPEILENLPKNCLLIDLASAPGGFDHALAQQMGLRCIWGTALPGKCAPESAGNIIADVISDLLDSL